MGGMFLRLLITRCQIAFLKIQQIHVSADVIRHYAVVSFALNHICLPLSFLVRELIRPFPALGHGGVRLSLLSSLRRVTGSIGKSLG